MQGASLALHLPSTFVDSRFGSPMASGDNINIITLPRGEIMLRMVKMCGAQLNQRQWRWLNHLAGQGGKWGVIMRSMQFMSPRMWAPDGRPGR